MSSSRASNRYIIATSILASSPTVAEKRTFKALVALSSTKALNHHISTSRPNSLLNISFPSSSGGYPIAPIAHLLPQVLFNLRVYCMHSEVREGT